MASLNLNDYVKVAIQSNDSLKLGVVQAFRQSPVLDALTFTDTGELKVTFTRKKSLPTPAFRKIGEDFASSKGDVDFGEDRIYSLGQYIDVDKSLIRMKNLVNDPRAMAREDALLAMNRTFHYYFINGRHEVDEDGLVGLKDRLIKANRSAQNIDAEGLDLTVSPITSTIAQTALNKLDELIESCEEGAPSHIFMNRQAWLKWSAVFRYSTLLSVQTDQLGRKFMDYAGVKFYVMGNHRDETDEDPGTQVIGNAEADDGSWTGGDDGCTSMYAVKFGKDALGGAQQYAMEVDDIGKLDDGLTFRDVVDWPVGIYQVRPRCVSRLFGLTVVAAGS